MIANFLSTRLNNGISYLESVGLYSLANTLYLAKERLKDAELETIQIVSNIPETYGSFGSFSKPTGSLNVNSTDYTKW